MAEISMVRKSNKANTSSNSLSRKGNWFSDFWRAFKLSFKDARHRGPRVVRYFSATGPVAAEGVHFTRFSMLLLDCNVRNHVFSNYQNPGQLNFAWELDALVERCNALPARIDASYACFEQAGAGATDAPPSFQKFSDWVVPFYESQLIRQDTMKMELTSPHLRLSYDAIRRVWADSFVNAHATLLTAFRIARANPARSDAAENAQRLFNWAKDNRCSPGIAGNLAIGLFVKEPNAMRMLKFNASDPASIAIRKTAGAAHDITYFLRLLELTILNPDEVVLLATEDAGMYEFLAMNGVKHIANRDSNFDYGCELYGAAIHSLREEEYRRISPMIADANTRLHSLSEAEAYQVLTAARDALLN